MALLLNKSGRFPSITSTTIKHLIVHISTGNRILYFDHDGFLSPNTNSVRVSIFLTIFLAVSESDPINLLIHGSPHTLEKTCGVQNSAILFGGIDIRSVIEYNSALIAPCFHNFDTFHDIHSFLAICVSIRAIAALVIH